jgi:diguanylate cyclase (GGDEF)-like protein
MAYAASAIFGASALDGAVEGLLPGDPKFSWLPVIVVFAVFVILVLVGPRLPRRALALLGPLGVALIADALATTPGVGDGAVLYALPVLWTSLFFGRRGAVGICVCVGVAHAIVLIHLPAASSYPGRWVDVMVAVCSIAVVVLMLGRRNDALVARLAGEARTDALTGLLNRRGFDERAVIESAHARREGRTMSVAVLDIDYFKRVNDEWGHEVGDRVLAHVGRTIAAQCREVDVAARVGGEEFAVLLPASSSETADAFTRRVRDQLAQCDLADLPAVRVSGGVATTDSFEDVQEALQRADSALYAAKRAGRDRTMISSPDAPHVQHSSTPGMVKHLEFKEQA